jgi:hypothetical protein
MVSGPARIIPGMGSFLASLHGSADALTLIGWLIVALCVGLAIWQATLERWLAVLLLLAVAIIAAYLLL